MLEEKFGKEDTKKNKDFIKDQVRKAVQEVTE